MSRSELWLWARFELFQGWAEAIRAIGKIRHVDRPWNDSSNRKERSNAEPSGYSPCIKKIRGITEEILSRIKDSGI